MRKALVPAVLAGLAMLPLAGLMAPTALAQSGSNTSGGGSTNGSSGGAVLPPSGSFAPAARAAAGSGTAAGVSGGSGSTEAFTPAPMPNASRSGTSAMRRGRLAHHRSTSGTSSNATSQ